MNHTHSQHLSTMIKACIEARFANWTAIQPHAENEFNSLLLILQWLTEMRKKGEMTTEQARIHIDIQKNTMRTRLMTLPSVSMVEAEHIINTGIDSIRKDLYAKIDWVII
jgi:hypothetical protein